VTPDDRYRVYNSAAVAEQFRRLAEVARASGRGRVFLAAAKWIMEELERTPTEFGESRAVYPAPALVLRRGFARPLYVDFAVREDVKVVYIRRFALVR
jgi:hypothetical protein